MICIFAAPHTSKATPEKKITKQPKNRLPTLLRPIISSCLFVYALLILACGSSTLDDMGKLDEVANTAVETVKNPHITYSDIGEVRITVAAPLLLRHKVKDAYTEFPEGIKVTFFDNAIPQGTLTADQATRYEKDRSTTIRNNVVWQSNLKNERLETDELVWDEKTKKITSTKTVKVTTDNEQITGEGLEAEQDFSRYKIKYITCTLKLQSGQFGQ